MNRPSWWIALALLLSAATLAGAGWQLSAARDARLVAGHQREAEASLQAFGRELQGVLDEADRLANLSAVGDAGSQTANALFERNPLIAAVGRVTRLGEKDRTAAEARLGTALRVYQHGRLGDAPAVAEYFVLDRYQPDGAAALPLGLDVGSLLPWGRALLESRQNWRARLVLSHPGGVDKARWDVVRALPGTEPAWLVLNVNLAALYERALAAERGAPLRLIAESGSERMTDSQAGLPTLATQRVTLGGQQLRLTAYLLPGGETAASGDGRFLLATLAVGLSALVALVVWLARRVRQRQDEADDERRQKAEREYALHRQLAERLAAEQSLSESEARLRAILAASTDAILLIDARGRLRNVNPAAARLVGEDGDSLADLPVDALIAAFYQQAGHGGFDAVAGSLVGQAFETELIGVDNRRVAVEISLSRVVRPDDSFYVAVCRDIRARKTQEGELVALQLRLERELNRQNRRLEALLEASPLAMAFVVDGAFREVNHAFLELFGHSVTAAVGQSPRLLCESEEDWTRLERTLSQTLSAGLTFQTELPLLTLPDGPCWCRLFVKTLDAVSPGLGAVWLLQDISTQKSTEATLTAAKELAEGSSRAKTEFLANMSHELRTPMHAILGFAEMGTSRSGPGDKLGHYFDRIHASGSRLLALLNDLLDLAKMEVGRMEYRIARHDFDATLRDACDEMAPLAAKRGCRIDCRVEPAQLAAEFDDFRIGQVLRNLLSNAIKVSPAGQAVSLNARLIDGNARELIVVTVSDAGPGIPPAEFDSVFEKFTQSSGTRTGAGGTGLGLAICREIVHAHRGVIRAGNAPAGGAELRFTLPRWRATAGEEGRQP
ncbi:ATP-binding protein [Crenobacter cavernae]|uniref:histidine kinase n=1 Tax=Crenobacter cavernae TaxID=2290923 RepID=A0ABY0FDL1_9NEIS|nr:ATP-binding protein [Crenobacter cavernae]RXZ44059.1 PAS domain S-box protein [Crenobacter cavernae]